MVWVSMATGMLRISFVRKRDHIRMFQISFLTLLISRQVVNILILAQWGLNVNERITAVSNQWSMPVNLWGGSILFDLWFTQYKVKGHLVQFVKYSN